jgi:hypothetical protein
MKEGHGIEPGSTVLGRFSAYGGTGAADDRKTTSSETILTFGSAKDR